MKKKPLCPTYFYAESVKGLVFPAKPLTIPQLDSQLHNGSNKAHYLLNNINYFYFFSHEVVRDGRVFPVVLKKAS